MLKDNFKKLMITNRKWINTLSFYFERLDYEKGSSSLCNVVKELEKILIEN